MGIFRRRPRSEGRPPANFYQEAESNPELLAAEREVNEEDYLAPLVNPPIDPPSVDPY